MKNSVIIGMVFIFSMPVFSQNKGTIDVKKQSDSIYALANTTAVPLFPGGEAALYKFLEENVAYPDSAFVNGISGTVYVKFVVEKDGSVTNLKIAKGAHKYLDDAALLAIYKMPKWIPATLDNIPVRTWFILPIKFVHN